MSCYIGPTQLEGMTALFIRQESARNVVSVKQEFCKKFLLVFAAEQTFYSLGKSAGGDKMLDMNGQKDYYTRKINSQNDYLW